MSDIVIKGMEMPKKNECVIFMLSGDGSINRKLGEVYFEVGKAQELPPHGDLIDKQTTVKRLMKVMCEGCKFTDDCSWCAMAEYRCIVEDAPVILEASKA